MLNNQNTYQNAGQNGSFFYLSIGNQSATFIALALALVLLKALLKSEERYRDLVKGMLQATDSR